MDDTTTNITHVYYEAVAYMQRVIDAHTNAEYYTLGTMQGDENTLAVTPVTDGYGGTRFFCRKHNRAYFIHGLCEDCQNTVIGAPV